jgi:hypothetical protein
MELAIKFIKQEAGESPYGVDVEITREDHELGSYPVISVFWDDYSTEYPEDYIATCISAFEKFDLPEEIYRKRRDRTSLLHDLQEGLQDLFERELRKNPH